MDKSWTEMRLIRTVLQSCVHATKWAGQVLLLQERSDGVLWGCIPPCLWHMEKSLRNPSVPHFSAILCSVGHRSPCQCSLLVREKKATLDDSWVQMQEAAPKRSKGWVCRCVAFECVGALCKEGDVTDGWFRLLEEPLPKVSAKLVLLKML